MKRRWGVRIFATKPFYLESAKSSAQEPQLEQRLFRSGISQIEFNEVAKSKELSPQDLAELVKAYGSYINAANAIWAKGRKNDIWFSRQRQYSKGRNFNSKRTFRRQRYPMTELRSSRVQTLVDEDLSFVSRL